VHLLLGITHCATNTQYHMLEQQQKRLALQQVPSATTNNRRVYFCWLHTHDTPDITHCMHCMHSHMQLMCCSLLPST
jgi:hypothetical protein